MKLMRWYDHLSVNLFWLGMNIRNTAVGSVFTPYLVALFAPEGRQNTALGAISAAGLIIAMLVQPAAGLLSDRSTSRFGRRRPFIFFGSIFDLLFLVAIALSGNFTMLLVATLLIQFSANVSHGPLQGLIPDMVPEEQRGRSSAIKAVMELIPIVLVGFTIAQLVGNGQFIWAVIVTGAALLLTMLLTMALVKETPLQEKPTTSFKIPMLRVLGMLAGIVFGALAGLLGGGLVGGLIGLAAWPFVGRATALAVMVGLGGVVAMVVAVVSGVWSGVYATLGMDARRNSPFTWWVVNRLLFLAAATSFQGFLPFFLMYAFGIDAEQAASMNGALMTVIGLFIILSAFAGGWVSDRFGKRRVVVFSGLVSAVGACMVLGSIWIPNLAVIYAAGGVIGLGVGLFMTANWALGTDLVPAGEAGRYLGISNLAGAGAGMIGKGIGGPIADYLNIYQPGLGYFAIFASYAVLFAMSAFSLRWVRKVEE
ncbi:MAG: MFS transporter [Chloroflexi bacterium]|nr:MFS transporter [Chloroflexota bacterium]